MVNLFYFFLYHIFECSFVALNKNCEYILTVVMTGTEFRGKNDALINTFNIGFESWKNQRENGFPPNGYDYFVDITPITQFISAYTTDPEEFATSTFGPEATFCVNCPYNNLPTNSPTSNPTPTPTDISQSPSQTPTVRPTNNPSVSPLLTPSTSPTLEPTDQPTSDFSIPPAPTVDPTVDPES